MSEATPPEYLPLPEGYAQRVADLEAAGHPPTEAQWMAACEAIGAVGRRESNDRALFWHNEASADRHELWDRISLREAQRYYFHQKKDTLIGYLAHGRHDARINTRLGHERQERLVDFIKQHGLWDQWIAQNKAKISEKGS